MAIIEKGLLLSHIYGNHRRNNLAANEAVAPLS